MYLLFFKNKVYKNAIFPLAVALNIYSLTLMFIVAGFVGKTQLAADLAIIQGGLLAIFLALSDNARSLILSSQSHTTSVEIMSFRLLLLIPASFVVYFLLSYSIAIPAQLVVLLIIRRGLEWLVEIELVERERLNDADFTQSYVIVNSIGLFILLIAMIFNDEVFNVGLFLWALLPGFFCAGAVFKMITSRTFSFNFLWLSPHIGSSSIIGISIYFFRLLIVILAGKVLAGQLFTAYALGGLINSLYSQMLGPTLINKNKSLNIIFIASLFFICCLFGGVIVIYGINFEPILYSRIFVLSVGCSLIGGGVMVLSQWYRLSILQEHKLSVFVPDALANILLLISIPITYFIFGETMLALMFLWSAILNFMIYAPLMIKVKMQYV